MAKTKEIEKDVAGEAEMLHELQKHKFKILEDFARAYLAEQNILPSEIELVHQQLPTVNNIIEHKMFFRKKET